MKYLKELEALRGLLALWVVIGHVASAVDIKSHLFEMKFYNKEAVVVFVILSGFAITTMLNNKNDGYLLFICRRFLRVFPTYLLFLALSVLLAPVALQVWQTAPAGSMKMERIQIAQDTMTYWWPHLLTHITGLQGLVAPIFLPSTDYAFIGQAWSISLEWQFYLVAPVVVGIILARTTRAAMVAAAVVLLMALAASPVMPEGFIGRWVPQFAVGIGTYYVLKNSAMVAREWQLSIWLFLITALVATTSITTLPYLVWVVALGVACLPHEHLPLPVRWARWLLNSRLLQYLGKISYSMYLSHMIPLLLILWIFEGREPSNPWLFFTFALAGTVLATLAIASASYFAVERPFHEFGRKLRFGRASTASEANVSPV